MLAAFSVEKLMADVPPTLRAREGSKIHDMAARDFGIRVLQARNIDGRGDWGQLALDISGSNKVAVFEFLQTVQAASVTIQPSDLPMYFSDFVLEAVKANWSQFQPVLTDIPPNEIVDACDAIGAEIWKHKPAAQGPDPFRDPHSEYAPDGTYIGSRELRDETAMEMSRQADAAAAAEREAAVRYSDPWEIY